ncbi:MAG TPA: hypothetical protein VJA18_04380 [Candidatus Nanoarchaeia archaeon]|nr:hypothetical protein [Candidatus Nanoarchaeia archaeon]
MDRPIPTNDMRKDLVYVTTVIGVEGILPALEVLLAVNKDLSLKIPDFYSKDYPMYWAVKSQGVVEFDVYRPSTRTTATDTFRKACGMLLTPLLQCGYKIDSYTNEEITESLAKSRLQF